MSEHLPFLLPATGPEVGIGWRQPHYRELLTRLPALGFLEVHSENFFAEGGAALAGRQKMIAALERLPLWHVNHYGRATVPDLIQTVRYHRRRHGVRPKGNLAFGSARPGCGEQDEEQG